MQLNQGHERGRRIIRGHETINDSDEQGLMYTKIGKNKCLPVYVNLLMYLNTMKVAACKLKHRLANLKRGARISAALRCLAVVELSLILAWNISRGFQGRTAPSNPALKSVVVTSLRTEERLGDLRAELTSRDSKKHKDHFGNDCHCINKQRACASEIGVS